MPLRASRPNSDTHWRHEIGRRKWVILCAVLFASTVGSVVAAAREASGAVEERAHLAGSLTPFSRGATALSLSPEKDVHASQLR